MIVGTAGHIDHGKTTLVRALTGVDTDRLPEEQRRGISIELGYAYQPLAGGQVLGYVDVPGHEKLVHTMLAGAAGIDFALLVVAADDGVMPQTREHLTILELLGLGRGAVALTKIDRVGSARRAEVAAAVRAELAAGALAAAPVYELNATDPHDPGLAALNAELARAAQAMPARPADGLFRLAIDRVFTLAGRGTMVAGTVVAGQLAVGDPVALLPAGLRTRARSIHTQNRSAALGRAGERCAFNLAGVELDAVRRGDWLADPAALAPTTRIDAVLHLLASAPLPLRSWTPLHLHWGTAHRVAHLVLLEGERLRPGERMRVQFVFDAPVCGAPGDRFIVRNPQASQTIGGGTLLDPDAPARRRRSPERLARLAALEALVGGAGVGALLEACPAGLSRAELARLSGRPAAALAPPPGTLAVGGGEPQTQFLVHARAWDALKRRALAALAEFHAARPDEPGPDRARLQRIAAPGLPATVWAAAIEELLAAGALVRSGAWLQLPAQRATLSARDDALAARLGPLLLAGRYDPPWVRELAAGSGEPEERVRQLLALLARDGRVFPVVRDLYYDREVLGELAAVVARLAGEHGDVEAARFRDAVGVGRKRAIQILEFFDRVGYTRRVGDAHRLRADSGWLPAP